MKVICPRCGSFIEPGDAYCPECGATFHMVDDGFDWPRYNPAKDTSTVGKDEDADLEKLKTGRMENVEKYCEYAKKGQYLKAHEVFYDYNSEHPEDTYFISWIAIKSRELRDFTLLEDIRYKFYSNRGDDGYEPL